MSNPIVGPVLKQTTPCEQGKCRNCDKPGLLIQPFRYSAFCTDNASALEAVPELKVDSASASAPPLETGKYGVRLIREGYIYVLVRRDGLEYWDCYYVRPSGRLMRFQGEPPERKSTDISCARMAASSNAMMIAIDRPEEVEETYWLFTPDPMSDAKMADYKANADTYATEGKLKKFSPKHWVTQGQRASYELNPATIQAYVLEHLAIGAPLASMISPLTNALDQQPFPPLCSALDPLQGANSISGLDWFSVSTLSPLLTAADLLRNNLQLLTDTKGLGLILDDAIGITQELNAWRNKAMEGMEPWMRIQDTHGISNQWKYLSATQFADVRDGIRQGRIQAAEVAAIESYNQPLEDLQEDFEGQAGRRLYPSEAERTAVMEDIRRAYERDPLGIRAEKIRRAKAAAQASIAKAEAHLDGSQDSILQEFDAMAEPYQALLEQRARDHLLWLKSDTMVNALHAYDDEDLHRGWAFAVQTGLAMLGMEASADGQAALDEWWKQSDLLDGDGKPDPHNLAWRTFGLNHQLLLKDLNAALANARALPTAPESWDLGESIGNGNTVAAKILDTFDKANAALKACTALGQVGWFQKGLSGVLLGLSAQFAQGVFKASLSGGANMAFARAMVHATQLRIGSLARELYIARFQGSNRSDMNTYWRGQINRRIREGVERELGKGGSGDFYQGRLLAAVGLLEAVNLMLKGKALLEQYEKKGVADAVLSRQAAEFAASGIALTAATMAVTEEAANWIKSSYRAGSQTATYSAVWSSRLALYGGFLGSTAGMAGAVFDGMSAVDAFKRKRLSLASAYSCRVIMAVSLSFMSLSIAAAGSIPFLEHLLSKAVNPLWRKSLELLTGLFARLAANEVLLASFRLWSARLGWVGLALTVLILMLTPDDYEEWCEKSVFRKDKSDDGYEDAAEEMMELMKVLRAAGAG